MVKGRLAVLLVMLMVVAMLAFSSVSEAAPCDPAVCGGHGPDCAKFVGKQHGPKACGF